MSSDLNDALFPRKVKAIPFNTELSPAEQTEIADTSVVVRQERAKAMLRKGVGVDAVMSNTGFPRREIYRLMAEVRNEQPPAPKAKPNTAPAMQGKAATMQGKAAGMNGKAKTQAKPAVKPQGKAKAEVRA
jgi:hypothetical protein